MVSLDGRLMTESRPDFYLGTNIDGVHINAEQLNVRSCDLNSLIGKLSYTEALFHILQGRLPTTEEQQLFDIVLVSFHGGFGLLPPTTFVPRIVAGTGVSTAQAFAAGILASGPYHVGAVEFAMEHYQAIAEAYRDAAPANATAKDLEQFAYDFTVRRLEAGETVGGFGHPLLRKDPRPLHMRRLLCEMGAHSVYFDIYDGVVRCMEERKHVAPNVDGITAAIILRLGFGPQYGTALFLHARSAGMLAHIVEEQTQMPYQTMRRFMILPMAMPKLFNADMRGVGKRFNRLRDSTFFKSLKGLFGRKQRQAISDKEQADLAIINAAQAQRAAASITSDLQTAGPSPVKLDPFVAAANAAPDKITTDAFTPEAEFEDCSAPELLEGAQLMLASCLKSLSTNSDEGDSAKQRELVEAALKLIREASS